MDQWRDRIDGGRAQESVRGVTTAVSSFGVASTGAAISGLSGAAAESATLAALGGGSLATGGGGMALGATALNFVTIGPALLVGGLVVKGQGTKALTQAREFEAKIAVAIAELDETDARLEAVDARARELSVLLANLTYRAIEALDLLESEPFDPEDHAPTLPTGADARHGGPRRRRDSNDRRRGRAGRTRREPHRPVQSVGRGA